MNQILCPEWSVTAGQMGSCWTSAASAGATVQPRIAIGAVTAAQMPRVLASEYCEADWACDKTDSLHSDDHLSSCVPFSEIPQGFRDLAQRITFVQNRFHFATLKKLLHEDKIPSVRWCCQQRDHLFVSGD
jgi:hypothetical protein